jgi:hypothetical protein
MRLEQFFYFSSEESPTASSTCPASSDSHASTSTAKRTGYCRLGNEHISLSSAGFTNFTFSVSGSTAMRALFRSILRIEISREHFITFKSKITEILSK